MHRNRYYADPLSLSFLEPQKNGILDHHYFAQKHRETSQSKFKPTLHSLFTFGWTQWGSSYLCVVDNHTCTIMSSCPFVSPPTHLRRECSPTIFGSITTLYLISRILGNPSWYTTVESGGLLGDVMNPEWHRHPSSSTASQRTKHSWLSSIVTICWNAYLPFGQGFEVIFLLPSIPGLPSMKVWNIHLLCWSSSFGSWNQLIIPARAIPFSPPRWRCSAILILSPWSTFLFQLWCLS